MERLRKMYDIISKMVFFNQRAARELWSHKPEKIQNQDIFNRHQDLCEIKEFVDDVAELMELEEQGLLLKLPCRVGDTVWSIFGGKVYEAITRKVTIITGLNNYQLIKIEAEFDMVDQFYNDGRLIKYGVYKNYLETVFLTKEEAEAKIKELENE